MPRIERVFIDWQQPALPTAAGWLLDRAPAGDAIARGDLSQLIVVVPGGRAGRRLLEILVAQCAEEDIGLSPPKIVTMGGLPELLYPPQRPFADELTQRLAWVEGLRAFASKPAQREELKRYIPAFPPAGDITRLLELADMLRGQHMELAADGLDFSHVAEHTHAIGQAGESDRWRLLQKVQRAYLDVLDGLQLWDKQTARLEAIRLKECRTDKHIVLVGTVDMNRTARQMLDLVAGNVTTLTFAPKELTDRFDEHGCVLPAAWADHRIEVDDARVVIADDPIDQADEAARAVARFDGKYRGDEITIGVCDERVVPQISRQFEQCGLNARWGPGRVVSESPPFRLLQGVAEFLERQSWRDFAALVRHADVETWLNARAEIQGLAAGDWLTALDKYQSSHVQTRLTGDWLGTESEREGERDRVAAATAIYDAMAELLSDFAEAKLPLAQWAPKVAGLLLKVYGAREFNELDPADRFTLKALEYLHAALLNQRSIAVNISPGISAADCIRWALDSVAGETVAPPSDPAAIELLGWLELPLDDAPALVVTSLNEGNVPKSSSADMFLPDSLRTRLGLDDNARRFARDAYALSVLAVSRDAWFIVGRRDADGYPLAPSRLLMACDDETLVQRAKTFFTPPPAKAARQPLAGALTASRESSTFTVPPPQPLKEPLAKLRVTAFRDYLACPYRFYLKQVAGVKCVDDDADELDGGAFGGLAHEVFNQFGVDERRHTASAEEIEALFEEVLQEFVRKTFGTSPHTAVAVQIEQLRRRLKALARVQADRAAAGWRIMYTEVPVDETVCEIEVDGKPFRISGRIDRIDLHEATGVWAIWDYKTSDTARKPAATHRKKDQWIDLQLPLYRHLAAEVHGDLKSILEVDGKIQLGYVQVPKSADGVRFEPAEWTDAELSSADECAGQVIRAIRNETFWPPADPPPDFSEELAGICLDGVFGTPKD